MKICLDLIENLELRNSFDKKNCSIYIFMYCRILIIFGECIKLSVIYHSQGSKNN